MSSPRIKLIIGLGNPGKDYESTYHNAGFLFLDYLNRAPGTCRLWRASPLAGHLTPDRILKSDQFMNESGSYVKKVLRKSGAKPEEVLIVHDDSDIELGKYKLAFGRGATGHHGIESIIKTLGTQKFWRLRVGIRDPKNKKRAEGFVLKKIGRSDRKILDEVFEKIFEDLFSFIKI